jgi:hypothetical protein
MAEISFFRSTKSKSIVPLDVDETAAGVSIIMSE